MEPGSGTEREGGGLGREGRSGPKRRGVRKGPRRNGREPKWDLKVGSQKEGAQSGT